MQVKEVLYIFLTGAIVVGCLCLLWVIIRFGLISGMKTKGAKNRLQKPDADGVETICGFRPPEALVEFYRSSAVIAQQEFDFSDNLTNPQVSWFIGSFIPLSPIDTKEWRKISGVNGLPLADNCDGGIYFLSRSGTVFLSDPRNHKEDRVVATSVEHFINFIPLDAPLDGDDEE